MQKSCIEWNLFGVQLIPELEHSSRDTNLGGRTILCLLSHRTRAGCLNTPCVLSHVRFRRFR